MPRLSLPDVTLICVAGVEVRRAIAALRLSMKSISFGAVKLLTHDEPKGLPGEIRWVCIPNLDSHYRYNEFVVFHLQEYVETSHCLLVQADGFVENPDMWRDDFLTYDYIGAPWPVVDSAYIDPFGVHQRVGNGGFSLRSAKLLSVPSRQKVVWEVNQGDFYKHMNAGSPSEDGIICVHNRHVYEEDGCKFAPLEVAQHFSRELKCSDVPAVGTFGFHRYGRLTRRKVKAPKVLGRGSMPLWLDKFFIR